MEESKIVHQFDGSPVDPDPKPKMQHSSSKTHKFSQVFVALLAILVLVGVASYLFIGLPAKKLLASIKRLQTSGQETAALLKKQDLGGTKNQLVQVKSDLQAVETDFQKFRWARFLPLAKNYYGDGLHGLTAAKEVLSAADVAVEAVAPYADIIGLKGLSPTSDGAKTAQDRINFILNTLEKLKPQLENIGQHLELAKNEVSQIDPQRYPETFRGQPVRVRIKQGITLLNQTATLTNDARPLLETAPYILGMDSPRKYLVLFQNDAELRPTGGFITAYAVLQVSKGKISTLDSGDSYTLDSKFTKKIPAPQPILKYLPKVPYWNLRDQNLSPDFKVSMDTFYPNYKLTGSPAVDGIISMDTQVLVELIRVIEEGIGKPLGVPGFGNFSAKNDPTCNCPQVFYALELYADVEGPVVWDSVSGRIISKPANYGQRKSFIGPIMYSILANIMAQPKSKMVDLFNTSMDLISKKHIQFYFLDDKAQAAVENFNLAGRVRDYTGDYLLVVDTNFAGAKTNTWVTYDANLKVTVSSDGTSDHTLTLTYKNPQAYFEDPKTKLKLNGVFRDWLRVYIPKGSQLVETTGFETGQATGDDLGKTVFEGFFTLTPLNTKTITLKYKSSAQKTSPYKLLIQKQAGAKDFFYQITVNGKAQPELKLNSDKELSISY